MPRGIIYKKNFFVWSIFVSKNDYFFLKLPFFTTKCAQRLQLFGPKLPLGVNKNCVKKNCSWHFFPSIWQLKYDKYDNKYDRYMTYNLRGALRDQNACFSKHYVIGKSCFPLQISNQPPFEMPISYSAK